MISYPTFVKHRLSVLSITLCAAFFAHIVEAQQQPAFKKFGIGIYGGPQLFGQIIKDIKTSDVTGFTAGLDLRFSFSENHKGLAMHIQPGYNTFRKVTTEEEWLVWRNDWKWQAIHIPVLFRYTFSWGKIRPFVEAGPTFRFRTGMSLHQQRTMCGIAGCNTTDQKFDLQPEMRQDIIALTAGSGVEFDLGKITIPVAIRIQEGIGTYHSREMLQDAPYYEGMKTRVVQVTAGIGF